MAETAESAVEEQVWLASHPTIRMGIMDAWPPMDYVDNSGRPRGIGVQFINALIIEGFPYYLSWCWGGTTVIGLTILGLGLGLVQKN